VGDPENNTLSIITSSGDIFISDGEGAHWGIAFHAESPLAQLHYSTFRKHLVAAGSGGIFYSDNGGRVWQKSSTNFNDDIVSLAEAQDELIAFGHGGLIATSSDGGKQWIMKRTGIPHFIHQIKAAPDNSLLLTGANGLLLRSIDGGESWQQAAATITEQDFLLSLLVNHDAQYAVGPPGTILSSKDNGQSWQTMLSLRNAEQGYFHQIISDGKKHLVIIAQPGSSQFSNDAGQNWQPIGIEDGSPLVSGVYDSTHKQFVVVGNGGAIFTSPDGSHWHKSSTDTATNLQGVTLVDNELFASGNQGTILRSQDHGRSWQTQSSDTQEPIQHIFPAGEILIATGLRGTLLRSADKGQHWKRVPLPETENLRMPVIDKTTGIIYVSGRSGKILFSRDQGNTWDKMPQVTPQSLKGLYIDNTRRMLLAYGERLIRVPLLN
jgi:photosystem II stability/assembly factor-like uncharacterized protein